MSAVLVLAGRRDEGREKMLKDIKEEKEMSRVCKTGKRNRKKSGGGDAKGGGVGGNKARFNFQRINLGNSYNSGGCESEDFL